MEITQEKVRQIAHLARLEFTEQEEVQLIADLEKILDWMAQLAEVDVENIEPLTHITEEVTKLRTDEAAPSLPRAKGLLNAPKKDSNYFRVPKVLDVSE